MSEKMVIVSAGGLGREVMWQIKDANKMINKYEILGFVDSNKSLIGVEVDGFPVLGDDDWLVQCLDEINVVIAVGSGKLRKSIYERLSVNSQLKFPSVFAEDVKCSDTVAFGQGCIVCLSNIITVDSTIGDFVVLNPDCTVGHDVVIDNYVTLNYSVNISGNVHIHDCVEIGTGTNVIQGKTIGNNAIIGAGSVVTRDIPDNCTAVGIPAKPIKFISE